VYPRQGHWSRKTVTVKQTPCGGVLLGPIYKPSVAQYHASCT